jgi:hypothetical protein
LIGLTRRYRARYCAYSAEITQKKIEIMRVCELPQVLAGEHRRPLSTFIA